MLIVRNDKLPNDKSSPTGGETPVERKVDVQDSRNDGTESAQASSVQRHCSAITPEAHNSESLKAMLPALIAASRKYKSKCDLSWHGQNPSQESTEKMDAKGRGL